ncbi:hypothetical protein E5330_14060, partial [Muribaculum intestinale]|nr:hypothetical protein [Muribaculum intestinale]
MPNAYFTDDERLRLIEISRRLLRLTRDITLPDDVARVRVIMTEGIEQQHCPRDRFGINPIIHNLETALLLCEKISPDRNMVLAILLFI